MSINKETFFAVIMLLLLVSACRDGNPANSSPNHTVLLDSSLGLGKKIKTLELPGRLVALNPDSANKVIIIGENGRIISTIYRGKEAATQPQSLQYVMVDADAMEIYIYSPQQHLIFVYDANGNAKHTVPVTKIHSSGFYRMKGKFIFPDTTDNKSGMYIVDSTGKYIDNL